MHHLVVESLLMVGCMQGSSGAYAYMCWEDRMAQVQGEHIMHCWHYGGRTEGDHGCWSEYCCNMSLSLSWFLWCLVDYGSSLQIWFIFRTSMFLGGA